MDIQVTHIHKIDPETLAILSELVTGKKPYFTLADDKDEPIPGSAEEVKKGKGGRPKKEKPEATPPPPAATEFPGLLPTQGAINGAQAFPSASTEYQAFPAPSAAMPGAAPQQQALPAFTPPQQTAQQAPGGQDIVVHQQKTEIDRIISGIVAVNDTHKYAAIQTWLGQCGAQAVGSLNPQYYGWFLQQLQTLQ